MLFLLLNLFDEARLHRFSLLEKLQFLFEVFVELVGPAADSPDVEGKVVFVLRGGADREGMPLELGYLGQPNEHPVTYSKNNTLISNT